MKLTNIINEVRYPATVDSLTMGFLYAGINSAAEKILDGIEKRTGSNANPISLQVKEGIGSVNKQLVKKKKLKSVFNQVGISLFTIYMVEKMLTQFHLEKIHQDKQKQCK